MHRSKSWMLVAAVAALWMIWVPRYFPAAGEYQVSADEGTYFRQAGAIVDQGLRGFSELARAYVAERPDLPAPLRIGHVLVSAVALSFSRSYVALSYVSAFAHAATFLVVFAFARKLWDERIAALASLLVLASPLANGLALRALADTHACLANVLALLSFVTLIVHGERKHLWVFAGALAWSLLVKETSYLLLPFYAGVLVLERALSADSPSAHSPSAHSPSAHSPSAHSPSAHSPSADSPSTDSPSADSPSAHSPSPDRARVWLALLLVPLLTLAISMALLGGPGRFYEVARIATTLNATDPHPYLEAFGSGPWYEYFVDFLLLSPLTSLLFLAFCGYFITSADKSRATVLVLSYFAFSLLVLAALPKNARFALPLDPSLRIGVAAMLVMLTEHFFETKERARLVLVASLAALLVVDFRAFKRYFVVGKIYDPVAYNLLVTARMIPPKDEAQTPEAYLALSLRQYQARDFAASIAASQEAIRLRPAYADAYNNLGLAYAELGRWSEAIAALEVALRLQPSYELAKNNLAWIRARAAGSAK